MQRPKLVSISAFLLSSLFVVPSLAQKDCSQPQGEVDETKCILKAGSQEDPKQECVKPDSPAKCTHECAPNEFILDHKEWRVFDCQCVDPEKVFCKPVTSLKVKGNDIYWPFPQATVKDPDELCEGKCKNCTCRAVRTDQRVEKYKCDCVKKKP